MRVLKVTLGKVQGGHRAVRVLFTITGGICPQGFLDLDVSGGLLSIGKSVDPGLIADPTPGIALEVLCPAQVFLVDLLFPDTDQLGAGFQLQAFSIRGGDFQAPAQLGGSGPVRIERYLQAAAAAVLQHPIPGLGYV